MIKGSETAFRDAISHAALSASLAFSFAAIAVDDASAQQQPRPSDPDARNIELETINVEGGANGEGGDGLDGDTLNPKQASSVKATAPVLNTPQTVTIVPKKILEERNAETLVEALKNTPGITFDAGENGFAAGGNQFNIRGFNSVGSIFVDGSRDNGSYTRDTFNIERVEVIKGPAADNGRGAAGGYVNTVTKVPHLDNFYNGTVGFGFDEYDSDARWRGAADLNHQIGESSAIRLNAMVENGGVPGREIVENNAWGFAPSLAFGLGTDFRAYLAYEHVERNDIPDSGVAFNRGGFSVDIPGAGPNSAPSNGSRDTFFGASSDYDDVTSNALLARFEYDINDWLTISNQTRWAEVDREARYRIPNPTTIPSTSLQGYDRTNETITNLTNLRAEFSTGSINHTVSTGFDFSREKSDANRVAGTSGAIAGSAATDIDTIGFYLYDTVELNEHWQITAGLRAEHYEVDVLSIGSDLPGGGTGFSDSETTLGGKIGVVYKPVEEGSLYASYGLSHLPHGSLLSNPDTSRTNDGAFATFVPGAKAAEFHNYEVGVKWDFFGGALSTTAALFRTEKHNAAYLFADDHATRPNEVVYGEQIVQGIELGVSGKITDAWSVFGGATFMKSERKHGADVDAAAQSQGGSDYAANAANGFAGVTTTNGEELAFTPEVSVSLWTTYRWDNGLTLGGGVQYVGESWIGRPDDAQRIIANGRFGKLPDHFIVNLMAAYEVNENITVKLNVDNVFDETYLSTANWNGSWGYLGAPRTFWLSTSFDF